MTSNNEGHWERVERGQEVTHPEWNKGLWRIVNEYENGTYARQGGWEHFVPPIILPKKAGVIIVPSQEWRNEHSDRDSWDTAYYHPQMFIVYDGDDWCTVDPVNGVETLYDDFALDVLKNGGTVLFDGIDEQYFGKED